MSSDHVNEIYLTIWQKYRSGGTVLIFHITVLSFMWNILINIAVILSLYKHKTFGYYSHAILCWFIIIMTLVVSLYYVQGRGIHDNCRINSETCDPYQFPLGIEGSIMMIWTLLQAITGIAARALQENPLYKSLSVLRTKRFHLINGLIIMLLGKFNSLTHWRHVPFVVYPLVAWELLSIAFYIKMKFYRKSMQEAVVDNQLQEIGYEPILEITSLVDEKLEKRNFVIFGNYVYDTLPLTSLHPAGYEVIRKCLGRSVDMFVYGMYSAEQVPEVSPFRHSADCFNLVGWPIAQIVIESPYANMNEQFNDCKVVHREIINERDNIGTYIIGLGSCQKGKSFTFRGYHSLSQIGRFFALTIENKITRLYTTVSCLAPSNIRLMQKILPDLGRRIANKPKGQQSDQSTENQMKLETTGIAIKQGERSSNELELKENPRQQSRDDSYIPLMIKTYPEGALTPKLCGQNYEENVLISSPRGAGLKLKEVNPGKIIFVSGGTGFFPFMDIIDILFKIRVIQKQGRSQLSEQIKTHNPICESPDRKVLEDFNFLLFVAIDYEQDLHPMSLMQCNELCEQHKFRCVFRVKFGSEEFRQRYPKIEMTSDRFDRKVITQATDDGTSKVYICGPSIMTTSLTKALLENHVRQGKIELV